MASSTEICNLALSHIGVGKEIANLTTEQSNEASACRRFYETARDAVLRDFNWPFATKTVTMALVEEDPTSEWDFSYRYPSDCLKVRRILSGVRNDNRQSRVPYRIAQDSSGLLLYTDQDDAEMEYTVRVTDPARFAPDFTLALSYQLGAYIAPRVAGGDQFGLGKQCFQLYEFEISKARASALNEEQAEEEVDSEFIRARGGTVDPFRTFFEPN